MNFIFTENNKLIKFLKIENLNLCNEIDINPELNNLKTMEYFIYIILSKNPKIPKKVLLLVIGVIWVIL